MAVLQVRTMSEDLYAALGRRATRDNRSISQEVITIIEDYLARPTTSGTPDEEGLKLAGTWAEDRSAEEITASIRSSRKRKRHTETL